MRYSLLLLQIANVALAAGAGYIYFRNLNFLGGQAAVFASGMGVILACATVISLGAGLLAGGGTRWGGFFLHLLLAVIFFGGQAYLFYFVGKQLDLFPFLPGSTGAPIDRSPAAAPAYMGPFV